MEFRASRVHSAKNLSAFQSAHLNNSGDMGDDDMRAWFPCPFCYVDIQVSAACLHLQEEHCFDFKNAVCPICAANLGKDVSIKAMSMIIFTTDTYVVPFQVCPICAANLGKDAPGHFTTQHTHLRRRKSQKSGLWNNNSMVPGKDMRELNSYHGPQSTNGRSNMLDDAPDPLLSPFLCSIPLPNLESNADADISCNSASTTSEALSTKSAMLDKAQEQDYSERKKRAAFVQQLILSAIF